MQKLNIPVSLLELVLINQGSDAQETLQKTTEIAQKADELDFKRLWFAEHHNMPHVASSATVVLISHFANHTQKIRIGSGGIMLPNHSPLVVAEQFGTLETLYPGRIDLGLGRAPGTDQVTAQALNKDFYQAAQQFPKHVAQLQQYLSKNNQNARVRAFPGDGTEVPIWILGSSLDSAILSSEYGLPYAFASHFAPKHLTQAFEVYHNNFKPSLHLDRPKTMAAINLIIADTQAEAELYATSMYKMFLNIVRGARLPISPPIENMNSIWSPAEEAFVHQMLSRSFIGNLEHVRRQLHAFYKEVQPDEIIITVPIFSHKARLKTLEYTKELFV